MLDEIAAQIPYELTESDIRRSPELFTAYRYRIPVIIINETLVIEGRIHYSELAHAFDTITNSREEGRQ